MDLRELQKIIFAEAKRSKTLISTAESCTGGLIAGALTELPGSSAIFDRGFVTYSNEAKQDLLGVTSETLDRFGAVSVETAVQMASGALLNSASTLSLSVTGIAGPGGSDFKPEGRVCFALAQQNAETVSWQIEFGAIGRHAVRHNTVSHALTLIHDALKNH